MMPDAECKHLNFVILGSNAMGMCHCRDCNKNVWLCDAFNNLAEEMRALIAEAKRDAP